VARPLDRLHPEVPVAAADRAEVEPLLREDCTHELDASRPLAEIAADLIVDRITPGDDL